MPDANKSREALLDELLAARARLAQLECECACRNPAQQARARVVELLDAIGDAYFTLDRDWRFTYLNANALSRSHKPAEELLGRTIWEAYPQLVGTPLERHYRQAMRTGATVCFEMAGILTSRWYEVFACPGADGLTVYFRDITERHQAEEALRASEYRHRAIAAITTDYIYACRIDPGGAVMLESASDGFPRVTGYTVEEIQAKGGWPALVHPDDLPTMRRLTDQSLDGRTWAGELRFVTARGETRWVRSSACPVLDPDTGRPVRVLGAVQDITPAKRTELALRAAEDLQRRILEAVPAGIVTVNRDGSMVQANAEAQRLLGLRWDDLSKMYVRDFASTTLREDGRPCPVGDYPVSRCLATGEPQLPVVIGVRRPDGHVAWAVYTALPLRDPVTGELRGAVVTFLDLTPRKQAEQALHESNERLKRFFEAAFEGIALHEGGIIRDANGPLATLFGYTVEELKGMNVLDLAAPSYRDIVRRNVAAGHDQPYEGLALRKDGTTVPVELCGKNIPYEGRTIRVTVLRDITERKRSEERLQEYARQLRTLSQRLMEVQETERRHLARELHDEVGQQLTALHLAFKAGAELPPEQSAARLAEGQRLVTQLMTQIRDLSQNLRPTVLDDLGLLHALLWHRDRYVAQTGVQVTFTHRELAGRRFRPEVETAAFRIVQEALTNVARHAGIREAVVVVQVADGVLQVIVEDRGVGFDPDAARTTRDRNGLSGMRERAALLGGRLLVQSNPGAGTCVRADLPLTFSETSRSSDADAGAGG